MKDEVKEIPIEIMMERTISNGRVFGIGKISTTWVLIEKRPHESVDAIFAIGGSEEALGACIELLSYAVNPEVFTAIKAMVEAGVTALGAELDAIKPPSDDDINTH